MPSFDLSRDPWIPVLLRNGQSREVNLLEVFQEAPKIAQLAGTPPETAALLRLLLAIAHLTETPESLKDWLKLWEDRRAYLSKCAEYVKAQGNVWDLFHPEHPFGQDPVLTKTENPAFVLVYEAARKNNGALLDHSLERAPVAIPPAKLACAMIAAQAFAGSSGGGYLSGPLAVRTVAMLSGESLAETLLLNLLNQKAARPADYDWTQYGREIKRIGTSLDISRRYLWSSRRLRLLPEEDGCVSKMLLAPGTKLPDDERGEDPMVALCKNAAGTEYVALRIDPHRALWRSLHVLLSYGNEKGLPAVAQLRQLTEQGYLRNDLPVSIRVCAVGGNAQGPATELWRDETLPFGLSVIADEARFANLDHAIQYADTQAKELRRRLYGFATTYLQNGAGSKPDPDDVKRLMEELSPKLRDYWARLAPVGEMIATANYDENAWLAQLKHVAADTLRSAVDRLPPDARRLRAQFARSEKTGAGKKTSGKKKGDAA